MTIRSIRISKTSFKNWDLHGPIDQALKTTIQAEAVRVIPINLLVHGEPVRLELWIDATHHSMDEVESPKQLNAPAMAVVQNQCLRDKGINDPGEIKIKDIPGVFNVEPILAPAVLTGAGGTDLPDTHTECMVAVLLGIHEDDSGIGENN